MLNRRFDPSAIRPNVPLFQVAEVGDLVVPVLAENDVEGDKAGVRSDTCGSAIIGVDSQSGVHVADRLCRLRSTFVLLEGPGA